MSGRIAVVAWMLSCLILPVSTTQAAGQTRAPSEDAFSEGLRPAPKLGPHRGLPIIAPHSDENPVKHNASLSGEPASPPGQRRASPEAAKAPQAPASPQQRPSMSVDTIQFALDSAQLTPDSLETLQNLGKALNRKLAGEKAFLIEGHTDRRGSRPYNEELSKRRAEAVKGYLVSQMGVSAGRLQTVGKGFSEPANSKNPYAADNRRVVIVNTGAF